MDYSRLANILFPNVCESKEDMEARFPKRDLPKGACVTRIGPSPTGFVHLGNLYNAVIAERLAHQSGGVFFLRIEDTDDKREVPGAVETVINAMSYFGVHFDEGAVVNGDHGNYGPYRQRQRREIYHVFAKWLVAHGMAYPCFLTAEELDAIRERQTFSKVNTGFYGEYAEVSRRLTLEQIAANLAAGKSWVLRYRGVMTNERIRVQDAIRGELEMPRNDMDFVLLKSDGIPTYHFAHVVDDHLMRTTHIIRGEEWLSSLPMHVELFNALGWPQPIYCHTATLMKLEGNSKRKLSKRKDPELALSYYQQEGICPAAVWEFLLGVLNSNFEEWRIANPNADYLDFPFTLEKMSNSGALVDLEKLRNISKDVIAQMTPQDIYRDWLSWCNAYDSQFTQLLSAYPERTLAALQIGRSSSKPRKDLTSWRQACSFMSFYYEETFSIVDKMPAEIDHETLVSLIDRDLASYDHADDPTIWFEKVKVITQDLGFAIKPKDFKKNPDSYKGTIVHITNVLRIALTGHANAPDIWEISHVLGEPLIRFRLSKWIGNGSSSN